MASFSDVIVANAGGVGTGTPRQLAYFSGVNVVSGASGTFLTAAGALTVASLAIGVTGSGFSAAGALTATSGTFSLPSAVNATLVMGGVAFGNVLAGIAFVQNTKSGTAAGSALYFGNDTGASGVGYVAGYSSAHATKPSYLEIMNTQNAPTTLGTNGVVRVTIGAAGAVSLGANPLDCGAITVTTIQTSGNVGFGAAPLSSRGVRFNAGATASAGVAIGFSAAPVLTATANGDTLDFHRITMAAASIVTGAFTGVTVRGLALQAMTVAGLTSPADPVMLDIGILTGTGATNAYALRLAPPTGATNNYLIAHQTPATFSVTGAGDLTATTIMVTGATQLGDPAAAALVTIGGSGYGAGVASVRFNGLTTAATNNLVGTLSNSPVTGNPTFWLPVSIAGVVKYIPCF